MHFLLLIASACFVASAQVMFKLVSLRMAGDGLEKGFLAFVREALGQHYLWLGTLSAGCGLVLYVYALRGLDLSRGMPIATSVVLVLTTLLSAVLLEESISLLRIVGIATILVGIGLVMRG